MKIQEGQTVLLTGASGGLGVHMAEAFAKRGAKLALVAYPGTDLESVRRKIERPGLKILTLAHDLRESQERRAIVDVVRKELGPIDILVNNAGVEFTAPYHELSEKDVRSVISVNLEAAMMLAHLVLPEMLQRRGGHIVNISSLAGKAGPAFQEPYAASKAGLIAFTFSLRASYRREGVSASVVVPGFVEAGIYAKLKNRSGHSAPAILGTSQPGTVVDAVMRAIEADKPEIIVNPIPVRPLLALTAMFPSLGEWFIEKIGSNAFFRRVVETEKNQKNPST